MSSLKTKKEANSKFEICSRAHYTTNIIQICTSLLLLQVLNCQKKRLCTKCVTYSCLQNLLIIVIIIIQCGLQHLPSFVHFHEIRQLTQIHSRLASTLNTSCRKINQSVERHFHLTHAHIQQSQKKHSQLALTFGTKYNWL